MLICLSTTLYTKKCKIHSPMCKIIKAQIYYSLFFSTIFSNKTGFGSATYKSATRFATQFTPVILATTTLKGLYYSLLNDCFRIIFNPLVGTLTPPLFRFWYLVYVCLLIITLNWIEINGETNKYKKQRLYTLIKLIFICNVMFENVARME